MNKVDHVFECLSFNTTTTLSEIPTTISLNYRTRYIITLADTKITLL